MKKNVAHENEFELKELLGRSYKLIIGSQRLPCQAINGGVSFFPPHAHAPAHVHQAEEEVAYCLEGKGEAVIGGKSEPICPGTFIIFPRNVSHSINNTGANRCAVAFEIKIAAIIIIITSTIAMSNTRWA